MRFTTSCFVMLMVASERVSADFFRNDFLPIGHVRTDPIIEQECLSDHVHTFYGPPLIYPKVSFDDLRSSDPSLSSGNILENQSLYWHPTVYTVASDGTKSLQESEMTTVYYNWIPGQTKAFPPGFRMITPGEEVFSEDEVGRESEMEISISFQECWDGINLDSPDHMSHVAFRMGERDNAPCPESHPVRLPRLDFFIRWFNTPRATWRFSDENNPLLFHADYISGWDEDFLQQLLDGGDGNVDSQVNFRAGIVHQGNDQELIRQMNEHANPQVDTSCITTEAIDNIIDLPTGSCTGTLVSPYGVCDGTPPPSAQPTKNPTKQPTPLPTNGTPPPSVHPTNNPTGQPTPLRTTANPTKSPSNKPTTSSPTKAPINASTSPTKVPSQLPTKQPTPLPVMSSSPTKNPTPLPSKIPTKAPTPNPTPAGDSVTDLRFVVCARGVDGPGGLRSCKEGDSKKVHKDEEHEVRCCKEQKFDGKGWSNKCPDYDEWIKGRSKIDGDCHHLSFWKAFRLCNDADGRLCTKEEVENSCVKGTGCSYDRELVWTCTEEGGDCAESAECCGGECHDGQCQEDVEYLDQKVAFLDE